MPTSSANPRKLSDYSTAGLGLNATLATKVTNLADSATTLSQASGSSHAPGLGDLPASFGDVAGDWYRPSASSRDRTRRR